MRLQRLLLWLWLKQWREQRYLYSRLDAYGTFSSFQLYEVLCTSYSVSREVESNQDTNSRISIWIFIRYEVLNIEADHCIDWDTGRDWTCQRNPMQIHQRILISIASLGEDTGSQLLYLCRYSMQITSYCSGPQTCPGTTATQQGKRRSCDEWWVSSTNEPYRESFPMHNGMASQSNTNLVRSVKRCVASPLQIVAVFSYSKNATTMQLAWTRKMGGHSFAFLPFLFPRNPTKQTESLVQKSSPFSLAQQ